MCLLKKAKAVVHIIIIQYLNKQTTQLGKHFFQHMALGAIQIEILSHLHQINQLIFGKKTFINKYSYSDVLRKY